MDKGIRVIRDLIIGNRLMSLSEIKNAKNLNHNNLLQIISIRSCITMNMRRLIDNANQQQITVPKPLTDSLLDISTKSVYSDLVKKIIARPTSEPKIQIYFEKNLTDDDWENIYCLPFLTTIESKLRSFQISINHFYYLQTRD